MYSINERKPAVTILAMVVGSFMMLIMVLGLAGCSTQFTTSKSPAIFVEATGSGINRQTALNEAFADAVQRSVGVLFESKKSLVNGVLVKDLINEHSAGFIERYEVLKERVTEAGLVKIEISAMVSSTKLVDRFIEQSKGSSATKINENLYAQLQTIINARQKGDLFLKNTLSGYPKEAFEVELGKTYASISNDRKVYIHVPYQIKWAVGYLQSFKQTIQYIAQKECWLYPEGSQQCRSDITFKTGFLKLDGFVSYQMNDSVQVEGIRNRLSPTVAIVIDLFDRRNTAIASVCQELDLAEDNVDLRVPSKAIFPLIYNDDSGGIVVYGNKKNGVLDLRLNDVNIVHNVVRFEAKLDKSCYF